jgi:nucleoid-associated protein YgaU
MGRTRVRHRRLALTLAAALVAGAWAGPVARALSHEAVPMGAGSYVVRRGDTLWSIAHRLRPGEDPRPLVDALAAANAVDAAALVPGQVLVVPPAP